MQCILNPAINVFFFHCDFRYIPQNSKDMFTQMLCQNLAVFVG
jgi:hypothetical protein